jgi:hypothetical protein
LETPILSDSSQVEGMVFDLGNNLREINFRMESNFMSQNEDGRADPLRGVWKLWALIEYRARKLARRHFLLPGCFPLMKMKVELWYFFYSVRQASDGRGYNPHRVSGTIREYCATTTSPDE